MMKIRKHISVLLVVALFLSAMMPFYAFYGDVNAASKANALFGNKILICTSEGFTWIDVEDIDERGAPENHTDYECPLCIVSATSQKTVLHDNWAALVHPIRLSAIWYVPSLSTRTIDTTNSSAPVRAPPFIG